MSARLPATFVIACLICPAAHASPELAREKNCLACHAVERRVLGPAWKDVAARYRGRPDMVAPLASKIRRGGTGAWGVLVMPANPKVNEAEARQLAQWILSLR